MEEDELMAKALMTKMQNSDSPLLEKLRSGAVISSSVLSMELLYLAVLYWKSITAGMG